MACLTRLLIIGPTPPPFHGVSVAIEALLKSRLTDVFDVTHLDLADRRGIGHVNKEDWHDVCLFITQWARLISLLVRKRPQLVYLVLSQRTIGFTRDSFFIWPAYLSGAKVIAHLHGGALQTWYRSRWWFMRWYIRLVLRLLSKAIVLGESFRPLFSGLLPDERVVVVSNGVDVASDEWSRVMPRGDRPWRILHLNTLNRMKGTLVLLAAIPTVLRHRRDVEFVFAGPWSHDEHRRQADSYIAHHEIGAYVTFTGEVNGEQKRALYRSADVFVFPGLQQEGQPLVVLEAMAVGLPILFTDQGCLRETVVNGESGIEVHTNDPYDLATQLCTLLDHPEVQEQLGRNARRRCRLLYTTERYVERMIQVFTEAAAKPVSTQSTRMLDVLDGSGKS